MAPNPSAPANELNPSVPANELNPSVPTNELDPSDSANELDLSVPANELRQRLVHRNDDDRDETLDASPPPRHPSRYVVATDYPGRASLSN